MTQKATQNEVQKLRKALGADPALLAFVDRYDRMADLWRDCPDPRWMLTVLYAAHYVPDIRLRRYAWALVSRHRRRAVDRRISAAVSVVRDYCAGKADGFDRRDAWAKAQSAAHLIRLEGRPKVEVRWAFAVAALAAPDPVLLRAVSEAVNLVARPRTTDRPRAWLQAQADALRAAIGNPFEERPHLALTLKEKKRILDRLNTRSGERRLRLRGVFERWEVIYQPLTGDTSVTLSAGSYADAVSLACDVAIREFAPLLAGRPSRRRPPAPLPSA